MTSPLSNDSEAIKAALFTGSISPLKITHVLSPPCVYQEMYSLDSSPDSEDEGIGKKEKKKKKVKKKKKKVSVTEFSKVNCR